jgi:hypothetical protein
LSGPVPPCSLDCPIPALCICTMPLNFHVRSSPKSCSKPRISKGARTSMKDTCSALHLFDLDFFSVFLTAPVFRSKIHSLLSSETDSRTLPSGLHDRETMLSAWPYRMWTGSGYTITIDNGADSKQERSARMESKLMEPNATRTIKWYKIESQPTHKHHTRNTAQHHAQ